MRRMQALLGLWLYATGLPFAAGAQPDRVTFLSTQLRPIEESQKLRNLVLRGFPKEVDYITDRPQQFAARVRAEQQAATPIVDVVGALHGDLLPLASLDALVPLDDLAARLTARGIPDRLLALGKLGTVHQFYIPWMQASYIMVANKAALPYLPDGADINALSYDQLATWASVIEQKTGKRQLGFPAGPEGLMHRFLEGFLYPSYTGGVVVPFRSVAAEAMWTQFARLWKSTNPNSTSYNFMRQPLLSGEVWIGFDHIARVLDALRQKPEEFVAFPAPAGPAGRGYMPVLAGLGIMKHAPHLGDAAAFVDYLTQPAAQIATARSLGFVPAVNVSLPSDFDPGPRMGIAAIEQMQSAKDALAALPPIGLGEREGELDNIFLNAFHLIVLRGQNPRAVLDREAEKLNRLMAETGTPCWQPDPAGTAACQAE
jgi:multiple sugar transport system substrate-binding protein